MFKLLAPFNTTGDQPQAIKKLLETQNSIRTLMGVTGSGKTFTIANVIAGQNKPVLILSPNKTLAAQLYEEFSIFFPENKVCYFVSYYDHYKPESYIASQDLYFPKETKINDEIERLRLEATASIINRKDVIVIASVSCIYSLGNPTDFKESAVSVYLHQSISLKELSLKLINIQYRRNDIEKQNGTYQIYPDAIEIILPYQKEKLRIDFFGKIIEKISWLSKEGSSFLYQLDDAVIFPAKHFTISEEKKQNALKTIEQELLEYTPTLTNEIYKERITKRTYHDIELIKQTGICPGIENYSSFFENRKSGTSPYTLFDFFDDFLLIIDESHLAIPQLKAMYFGDQARKQNLVDFGFRLPSAKDNRPLKFDETEKFFKDVIFISATPGEYELSKSTTVAQQIIRPTFIVDPKIEIRPRTNQIEDVLTEIKKTTKQGYRTLITVLTKKLAEELADYLENKGIKVCYIHHELKTPQRTEQLHKLREGIFDCLVGVNLLREGLDLPEVALIIIMDADIEGFLRDRRSLIQTIGRAARNIHGHVIMYADKITQSMQIAMDETNRRRQIQEDYNIKHNLTAKSTERNFSKSIVGKSSKKEKQEVKYNPNSKEIKNKTKHLKYLELEMQKAAEELNFEKAIQLRQEWLKLQE